MRDSRSCSTRTAPDHATPMRTISRVAASARDARGRARWRRVHRVSHRRNRMMRGHAACRPAPHRAGHRASACAHHSGSRRAPERPRRSRAGCGVDAPIRRPAADSDFPRIATPMASRGVSRRLADHSGVCIGRRHRLAPPVAPCDLWVRAGHPGAVFFPLTWSRSLGARSGKTNGRSRHGAHGSPETRDSGG